MQHAHLKKTSQSSANTGTATRTPSAAACRQAVQALAALHGMPDRKVAGAVRKEAQTCGERHEVLAAVVATILSQNTTAKNARAAMDSLWEQFDGDWHAMIERGPQAIAQAIHCGGLSNVKGQRIHDLLRDVVDQRGEASLEHLHALGDTEVKTLLQKYQGIGPKTASCVLLFALQRDSFAVDTHVLRIAKRLGWVAANASREKAHHHLDARVPAGLKYPLHVLLVHHGKCCPECAAGGRAQRPAEGPCPLSALVPRRR